MSALKNNKLSDDIRPNYMPFPDGWEENEKPDFGALEKSIEGMWTPEFVESIKDIKVPTKKKRLEEPYRFN